MKYIKFVYEILARNSSNENISSVARLVTIFLEMSRVLLKLLHFCQLAVPWILLCFPWKSHAKVLLER